MPSHCFHTSVGFTLLQDADAFGRTFHLAHYSANDLLSLSFAMNNQGLRSIDLGPCDALRLGRRLLRWYHTRNLDPPPYAATADDYSI